MSVQTIFESDHSITTLDVPVSRRVGYWQDHVRDSLIGIDCTASDAAGLNVSLNFSELGDIGIAELVGNRHVVERNRRRIRSHHKESLFVCLQLTGMTHILQAGECLSVEPGDLFHYATCYPYVHGNTSDIHTLIVDIPLELAGGLAQALPLQRPGKLGRCLGMGGLALSGMVEIAKRLRRDRSPAARRDSGSQLLGLLDSLLSTAEPGGGLRRTQMYVLLQAKALIEKNLESGLLDSEFVARAVGMSARQINRIFEREGTTISRFIWRRRLERAHDDLLDPALRHLQVAEIAFRWGFSSAAHFSRVYRLRYGLPPGGQRHFNA